MNPGFRGWARPRHKVFVGEPQAIDTTNGNTFRHGMGRVPGHVVVKLVCVTDNNGFVKGNKIPVQALYRAAASNTDGRPFWFIKETDQSIVVFISSANIEFQTSAFANVTFTHAQWKVEVRCEDIERVI